MNPSALAFSARPSSGERRSPLSAAVTALLLAMLSLGLVASPASASGNGSSATVTVTWDCSSIDVTSTKDISNVELYFADGTDEKFDNLSDASDVVHTYAGTDTNTGKRIVSARIKSGANGDDSAGPGEGVLKTTTTTAEDCASEDADDGGQTPPSDQPPADVDTEEDYVLAVWETVEPYPNHFSDTQTLHASVETDSPDLDQLDDTFECGSHYQVDLYNNSQTTTDLLAGGVLHGPNNPTEDLARYGEGNGWKFVSTPDCTQQPLVETTTTEWVDGDYQCGDTTVDQTRQVTTTTTTYTYNVDTGEFDVADVSDVTETETRTRDLTAEDFADLDCTQSDDSDDEPADEVDNNTFDQDDGDAVNGAPDADPQVLGVVEEPDTPAATDRDGAPDEDTVVLDESLPNTGTDGLPGLLLALSLLLGGGIMVRLTRREQSSLI